MEEIWKDVCGFEGRYKVSNFGNVLSMRYGGHDLIKKMTPSVHHTGYTVVCFRVGKKKITKLVHVLVATAFIDNPDSKRFVNHKDGNKQNNRVDNLEWVTSLENIRHAINTGLRDPHNIPRKYGKEHYSSKPVLQYDCDGNFVKMWDCQSDAARAFGVSPGAISACIDNPSHTYRGFMWLSYSGEIIDKIPPTTSRMAQKPVYQYDLAGCFVKMWNSSGEAASALGIKAKYIRECCMGRQKSSGGFVWKYAEP